MNVTEIQSKLKERVAKGLNFGIEAVEEVIDPASDLYNEFILLKSQYNDLMYISTINTLPYEQIEIGMNRLRSNVLGIIDKIESPGLKKTVVESDLKIQALPTRRDNFFKLLDIHFKNLEAIRYVSVSGDDEELTSGRAAVYNFYQMHKLQFRNQTNKTSLKALQEVQEYFRNYFEHESGAFEVYFKNIQHLIGYTLESEVEQQFFLNTVRSLFSRFEQGHIFYYAVSGLNPEFADRVRKASLIEPDIQEILISENHYRVFTNPDVG